MTDNELLLAISNIVQSQIEPLNNNIQELKQRVSNIEDGVTDIKLTLDNEIRVNIQRVAEGHLDLSRNLHEVIKPNSEVEMLAIKVRMLETDIREIKQKI